MKYCISVQEYTLDENKIVLDTDGGEIELNDAEDFVKMWRFMTAGYDLELCSHNYLIAKPKEIGRYVTEYHVSGDSYRVLKEYEEEEKRKAKEEKEYWKELIACRIKETGLPF